MYYSLIFLLVFLSSCASFVLKKTKTYEESLLHLNNLRGKIKTIYSETFEAAEKMGEIIPGELTTHYPNVIDNPIPESSTNLLSGNYFYEFSENGKLLAGKNNNHSGSASFSLIYNTNWIPFESWRKEKSKEGKLLESFTKYKILDGNIVSSITVYNRDKKENSREEYRYKDGLLTGIRAIGLRGEVLDIKYTYEDEMRTESVFNSTNKLLFETKTDGAGRIVESSKDNGDSIKRCQVEYKEQHVFPSQVTTYDNEQIASSISILLDDKHNASELTATDKDGNTVVYRCTYKYDDQDNWIERTTYENDLLKYITTRTIEYYEGENDLQSNSI